MSSVPRHDLLVVMGYLNSTVENSNTEMDKIIGKHGCVTINDNGERLVKLCEAYNLVVNVEMKLKSTGRKTLVTL